MNSKSLELPGRFYSRPIRISDKSPAFMNAFEKDIQNVPDDVLRQLRFDKRTAAGLAFARDEVFADTFAHATGFPTKKPWSPGKAILPTHIEAYGGIWPCLSKATTRVPERK
jgi:hypothetical protein